MRDFDLLTPSSLSHALDILAPGDAAVRPLAGGTDLLVDIRAARAKPTTLVSLQNARELQGVSRQNGSLTIGAATPIAQFLKHPLLLEQTALRQAASVFANPMIRNTATIAGNIASASPAGDMLPPLLALDAKIQLISQSGTRILPLQDFFLGPRNTTRRADELISNIQLPTSIFRHPTSSTFYKLGLRQADAISLVSVAVWLERDGDKIRDVRIALGAVAPRPLRALRAEALLSGQVFDQTLVEQAAKLASEESSPIDDLRASAAYRKRMVRVYVRRMLEQAWENTK
jgi:carbon-monoxide dehydrogenase medium subunit